MVTINTEHYIRLLLLNAHGATPVLRETLTHFVKKTSNKTLGDFLLTFQDLFKTLKAKRILNETEYNKLIQGAAVNIVEWDISLLCCVLVNCCTLQGKLNEFKCMLQKEANNNLDTFVLINKASIDTYKGNGISEEQYNIMFPANGIPTDNELWDIDLITFLLINVCTGKVQKCVLEFRRLLQTELQLKISSLNLTDFLKCHEDQLRLVKTQGKLDESQFDNLFPSSGLQADIYKWDTNTLRIVVLNCTSSLSNGALQGTKKLREIRNKCLAHREMAEMENLEYLNKSKDMIDAIDAIIISENLTIKSNIDEIIKELINGPIIIKSALDILKDFYKDSSGSLQIMNKLDVVESKVNSIEDRMNTGFQRMDEGFGNTGSNIQGLGLELLKRFDKLEKKIPDSSYSETAEIECIDMIIVVKSKSVDVKLKAEKIIKTAMENAGQNSTEKMKAALDVIRTKVIQDGRTIVEIKNGSIIITIKCTSLKALHGLLGYIASQDIESHLHTLASAVTEIVGESIELTVCLSEKSVFIACEDVLRIMSAYIASTSSLQMTIRTQSDNAEALQQMVDKFKGDQVKAISEGLSTSLGEDITVDVVVPQSDTDIASTSSLQMTIRTQSDNAEALQQMVDEFKGDQVKAISEGLSTSLGEDITVDVVVPQSDTDQLASIKTSQTHTADGVSTILKLIKRGKRPAVHGTKLNRKQYQRVNTLKCLEDITKETNEQSVDRTELNRKKKQAKLRLKDFQQKSEEFNIPDNTRMTEIITKQLQKNKIVVLKGIPGAGKSHLAKNVLNHFLSLNSGIYPLIISKAIEIERVLDPDESVVLLVDDMIGKIAFDRTEYNNWIQYIETFMSNVKVGQLYVVVTIRTAIFRQCQTNEMSNMFATENVIETDGYLLENEKRDILESYRKYHGVDISSDQSDQIVQQPYLGIGFPLLCRMMLRDNVDEFFLRPTKYIKDEISRHASENPHVFVTLFLTLVGDDILNKHELTQDQKACFKTLQDYFETKRKDMDILYQTAHRIEKTYITFNTIENNFSFIHEAVAHSTFEVALEIQPDTLIERCPFDLLIRNMNLMTETSSIELKPTNPYLLHKQRIIERMIQVLSLEDCTNIRHVTSATIWKEKTFSNDALCMFDTKHLYKEDENGMSMLSYFASCGRKHALETVVGRLEREHIKPIDQLQNALGKACKSAEKECVDYLLRKGADINGHVVIEAVKGGNIEIVQQITNRYGFDKIKTLKEKDTEKTLLHIAAEKVRLDIITYIHKICPSLLNTCDRNGCNAAHLSAKSNSIYTIECLEFLFNMGIDPKDKNAWGSSILQQAAFAGNIATVRYICQTYPDMIQVTDTYGNNALHHAAQSGSVECMKFLVAKGLDPGYKNNSEETILHQSALRGNITTMKYICETYPDMIQVTDTCGRYALHHAAQSGSVECMKFLVDKGLDPGYKNDDEETILHPSAMCGNITTMKYICETYPDMIQVTDTCGRNALHHAAQSGSVECMKFLVDKGLDPGFKTNSEETILHLSAMCGNITTMKYICETYPDMIQVTDKYGRNALHGAPHSGSVECMKFLVDKGLDPGYKNDDEETILHRSALGGNITTMKYICETYPDMIQVTDKCGRNALYYAAQSGSVECMKFLVDKGLDPGYKNDNEETILHQSALGGNITTMKYICETYPDMIQVTDTCGRNALHHAAKSGSVECMKFLVDKGLDPGYKTNSEETILHRSALGVNITTMKYICETYPDMIQVTDTCGINALHDAAYSGSVECMKFLVDKGLDPGYKTNSEETILHRSALGGNITTMKYICETYPDMIQVTDKYGRNALHGAPHSGSVECMKFLVDKGLDPGYKNDDEETILHQSALGGNITTMKYICETYPDMIQVTDKYGRKALHGAAQSGSVECMKFLVDKGLDPGYKTNGEETILHPSAMCGNITTMKYICETYPYMIQVTDKCGRNALHGAAQSGSVECMKFLVDKGLDPGYKNDDEETILHQSAMRGNITTMKYICETYPDMIQVTDTCGRNALHHAAQSGSVECMKFLVDKGLDPGYKTNSEETILHRSALGVNITTMKYICETYPDMIQVTDTNGYNALHNAAHSGSVECMKFLVDKGLDPGYKPNSGETILHRSAMGGNITTMKYICETYPDMIQVTDTCGRNALHGAAYSGSVECMKFLVDKGLDPGYKNDDEETILHQSAMGGNITTMKYICETYPDMIQVTDTNGDNALHDAAHSGSVECMKFLVDKGLDPGYKNDDEETILHQSAMGGNITTMKYIYKTYPNMIHLTDKCGRNALHKATYSRKNECMKFLVDKGIYSNDKQ